VCREGRDGAPLAHMNEFSEFGKNLHDDDALGRGAVRFKPLKFF
jgi:hypothetical protein